MERLIAIGGLFVLGGLCGIGGGYLVWSWRREHKPVLSVVLGALVLAAYGVVAALQPISEFGRVYAAYGGIFIALSLAWGGLRGRVPARQVGSAGRPDLHCGCRGDGCSTQGIEHQWRTLFTEVRRRRSVLGIQAVGSTHLPLHYTN